MSILSRRYNQIQREKKSIDPNQTTLTRLISEKSWTTISLILKSVTDLQIDNNAPDAVTEDTIIHLACEFQAPLRIIRLLSSRYPRSVQMPDSLGRFPIHVAAKWSATPDVIQFLVWENPTAVGIKDDCGKIPMHYVGEYYVQNYDPCLRIPVSKSMKRVVEIINKAAPSSSILEDNDGMNAIEYAIESGTDLDVVQSIQNASIDYWRDIQSKVTDERKRHTDLVQDVERTQSKLQTTMMSTRLQTTQPKGACEDQFDSDFRLIPEHLTVSARIQAALTA